MDAPASASPPSVRVRHGLGDSRRPITVIHVCGEHDYAARAILVAALEPLAGHIVVDLTPCTFLDPSVIGAIIGKALALGKTDNRLELVVPGSGSVSRMVGRLGIDALIPLIDEPPTIRPIV
jgi:hypothetical protein